MYTFEFLPGNVGSASLYFLASSHVAAYLIFANSLLILFSSSSLALAFRRSAINCTNPRIFELFPEEPRLKKLLAAEVAMIDYRDRTSRDISDALGRVEMADVSS